MHSTAIDRYSPLSHDGNFPQPSGQTLVDRAKRGGCSGLVLTHFAIGRAITTSLFARQHRERHSGQMLSGAGCVTGILTKGINMIEPTSNDERQYSAMSDDCKWNCYCTDDYFALSHYSGSANIHHQLTLKQAQEIIKLLEAGIKWTLNA